ncbi:peptide ligase PGM1-related protein [Streptomyces sp. CBMA152]|uniref:preATP grasp domain-containing protein n=1 Tax=Streptomyces sp. CBMA152 TaxID=1896312 RepID=UPI001660A1C3|nr:peptide ligase PGM1-related protein [Streptomyces sp. CBMA152]
MPKLVLANGALLSSSATPDTPGFDHLTPAERSGLRRLAQRAVWCAEDGDLLVVPVHPGEDFLAYATQMAGLDRSSLEVVVAPFGEAGVQVPLGHGRRRPEFERRLREVAARRGVDRLWPYFFDTSVAAFAARLGLAEGTPGFAFMAQGGAELLNDKATFRALAAGVGASVPEGVVTADRGSAAEYAWDLLAGGHSAILKRTRNAGGLGNVLFSPEPGVEVVGANRHVVVDDRAALEAHLAEQWPDYTASGRHPVVIERYHPSSVPLYTGLHITDGGITPYGHGEMRMAPLLAGVVVPPQAADHPRFPDFLAQAERIGAVVRTMGYRGRLSVDAMLTPDGRILLNEINARAGGATHTHNLGVRVGADRHLLDGRHRPRLSLSDTLRELDVRGLAYDPKSRTGVVVTVHDAVSDPGYGELCAVSDSPQGTAELERAAHAALAEAARSPQLPSPTAEMAAR